MRLAFGVHRYPAEVVLEGPCRRHPRGRAGGCLGTDVGSHGSQAWGELILDVEVPLRYVNCAWGWIRLCCAQFIRRKGGLTPSKKVPFPGLLIEVY